MRTAHHRDHVILTTNGVEGACAAAAAMMKHPEARMQITSEEHLPKALDNLAAKSFSGTAHVCNVSAFADELPTALARFAKNAEVVWYLSKRHPELRKQSAALSRHATFHFSDASTVVRAILELLCVKSSARTLLLCEVAEEAARNKMPRSELHRLCHDLVAAANRRFFFFGDDTLNEKAVHYLAGLEERSRELDDAVEQYRRSPDALYPLGSSRAMKELRRQIGRIGPVPEPVLIIGPTGSGKELMAKALHVTSGRTGAFVPVNCAVLGGNPALVEDRLFGHVKGAFTGADRDGKGAFEEANNGTLFLDEIGELPAEVQAQLLRVLEDKEVRPLGTMTTLPVDVRVVAATHRDLGRMVSDKLFREDLFYRLNVLMVRVPHLRERPDDMKSLATHILHDLAENGYPLTLTAKDWEAMRNFDWPGNVRQFLNVLKRAAYLARPMAEILQEESDLRHGGDAEGFSRLLKLYCPGSVDEVASAEEVYRAYVRHVFELLEGNITRTAHTLGIAPNTLRKYV
jgi:DNA-binding NtrC family response regulator